MHQYIYTHIPRERERDFSKKNVCRIYLFWRKICRILSHASMYAYLNFNHYPLVLFLKDTTL